jgi:mannose-6-phosphate isomerase-like protein (cupin superfamily)
MIVDTFMFNNEFDMLDIRLAITEHYVDRWIILEGRIRAFFYDIDNSLIYETDLIAGDCAVVFKAGHSFEVTLDNTVLYEVKNGPYYGQQKDKIFI